MKQFVFGCVFVVLLVSVPVRINPSGVKRTRKVISYDDYYELTSEDLTKLAGEGVPAEVIAKLASLRDQEYIYMEGFEASELEGFEEFSFEYELTKTLGPEQAAQYKALILRYAKKTSALSEKNLKPPTQLEDSFEFTWDGWKVAVTLCIITAILVGYNIFKRITDKALNNSNPPLYQLIGRRPPPLPLQEDDPLFHLRQQITGFLRGIPSIHDRLGQQAFLNSVGFDESLHHQLPVGEPPAQFVELLVSTCMKYGKLQDGRHSLKATLEAAKMNVGKDKQAYCETLIGELEKSTKNG